MNDQYDSPRKYRIRNEDDYYYDDDDISLGERKHKGKRSSDYRKRYPKSLPPAGFRMPKSRGSGKKDRGQIDRDSASSDEDDVRGRTAKRHGKKITNPRGRQFGHAPSPVKLRQKHSPVRSNRVSKSQSSMLESFH